MKKKFKILLRKLKGIPKKIARKLRRLGKKLDLRGLDRKLVGKIGHTVLIVVGVVLGLVYVKLLLVLLGLLAVTYLFVIWML